MAEADQDQGNYFERIARQQASEDNAAKAADAVAVAPPSAPAPPAASPKNPFAPPFSVIPDTSNGADPSGPLLEGGPEEKLGNALADWKSWLPAAGATAAELGLEAASGPPGWLLGAATAAAGAGAGSLLKSGLEKGALPTDADSLKTAGWDAAVQGAVPKIIGSATGATLGRIFDPERMYHNALRPTGLTEEAEKSVRGGLEGKIGLGWGMADSRAANQARGQALNTEIENLINSAPGSLSPQQYTGSVQNGLDKLRGQWMMDPIEGRPFLQQIDDAEREFLIAHGKAQPIQRQVINNGKASTVTIEPEDMTLAELRANTLPMSPTRAQAIKQAAYRTTRANQKTVQTAWSSQYQSGLGVEARNAISSALREDLENYPGLEKLKDLNRQSGDSQALDKALEKFARRNLPALGTAATSVAGAAGGFLLGHSAGTAALGAVGIGLVKHALEDPLIQSRLAIALYGASPVMQTAVKAGGRAAVRLAVATGKILLDSDKVQQELQQGPRQAKGGPAKSDGYLEKMERRAYDRKVALDGLTR